LKQVRFKNNSNNKVHNVLATLTEFRSLSLYYQIKDHHDKLGDYVLGWYHESKFEDYNKLRHKDETSIF
jgi:hypothetical protein